MVRGRFSLLGEGWSSSEAQGSSERAAAPNSQLSCHVISHVIRSKLQEEDY